MWWAVYIGLFQTLSSMFLPQISEIGWHLTKISHKQKAWRFSETQCIQSFVDDILRKSKTTLYKIHFPVVFNVFLQLV